ncbi:lysis system i-spanin subunit Rz [Ralstonia sp. UNC404CL21Col]|uniref:lysis system i-spanin subunit Rz n=1 Tax=Ralstonia sp. UNC404CL21Col TaxID=1380362 RepID=UPI0004882BA7|nr:lysis system i-spanin subunit Rz [Ralstonia sp. UNC404CL21Col]
MNFATLRLLAVAAVAAAAAWAWQADRYDKTIAQMQRATAENTRLQRALAAGDVRMTVRARCQPDAGVGTGEDQPGPGLGDGAAGRCELSGEDAADLVDLFAGAERDWEKLRYLQARERAVERAGVCVSP